jgi:large subunit ribosomal protein L5
MHHLEFYYKTVIQQDLINKFNYNNIKELPQLKKIILNFKIKNFKTKTFAATLFAIELISTKKSTITTSKKPNIFLKIQKGQPVGGKVMLKKKMMYHFLALLILEIFPKTNNCIKFKPSNKNNFSIKLNNDNLTFSNLKEHYNLSDLIPYITIIITTNSKTQTELFFLLRSFQFNLKQSK